MTQLLSLFNQVFGNQSKSNGLEQSIKKSLNDLVEAWIEARSAQARYYRTHSHIE